MKKNNIILRNFYVIVISISLIISCSNSSNSFTTPTSNSNSTLTLKDYFLALNLTNISVNTDGTTYKVSSDGYPTHKHTDGIIGWNQRVPLPQDFTGDYAFPFPVTPTLNSSYPAGVNSYLHSSVALAINGIPIFVPYKQNICSDSSLVDSSSCELLYDESNSSYDKYDTYLANELDSCGGHSGRGDDYHYHRYPQGDDCLEGLMKTAGLDPENDPWAYAYDGFPIYGPLTTSDTDDLDKFNGHQHENNNSHEQSGLYHYHARTDQRPYVLGGLAGEISTYSDTVGDYTVSYVDIGNAGTTQSPRKKSDCFEDEPNSSGITYLTSTDNNGNTWFNVMTGTPITISSSGNSVQKTMYQIYEDVDGSNLFDFYYYASNDDTTSISNCDALGLSRNSTSSDSSSDSSLSLQVKDLKANTAYHFTSPQFNNGYLKWASSSSGQFAALRSTPNFTDSAVELEWYQNSAWTLVSAVDGSSSGYSLQSVYNNSYYLYGINYNSSTDDADIDHVIKVAELEDYSVKTPYKFTIYDASTIDASYTTGVVIECTGLAEGTYMQPVSRSDDNGKDMFCSSGLTKSSVFYITLKTLD